MGGAASREKGASHLFIPGVGGGRSCLHPTGLFRSFLAAGLLGHLQKVQSIRVIGGSGGIEDQALAEVLTKRLGKALAGVFHLGSLSFLDRYRGAARALHSAPGTMHSWVPAWFSDRSGASLSWPHYTH